MGFHITAVAFWLLTAVTVVAQALLARDGLPARVASHFDAAGLPNGWMARDQFLGIWLGVILVCNAIVALPRVTMRWSPDLLTLPNRRFWLSTPERRAEATRVLTATVAICIALTNMGLYLAFDLVEQHAQSNQAAPLPMLHMLVLLAANLFVALVYPTTALKRRSVL